MADRGMGRGLAAILSISPTDAEPELREAIEGLATCALLSATESLLKD